MNTSTLKDSDTKDAIKMVTQLSKMCAQLKRPIEQWDLLVDAWRKVYQIVGKKVARDRNKMENELQIKLNETKLNLECKGVDAMLEKIFTKNKHRLRFIQRYKIQGERIREKMNWLREGDI